MEFWVKCTGYTQNREHFFTVGREYLVCDGHITNDNGFIYDDIGMTPETLKTCFLSGWYKFELADGLAESPADLHMGYDDLFGNMVSETADSSVP